MAQPSVDHGSKTAKSGGLGCCIPVRYLFAALAFIGFIFNYTLRINMNLVITSMVNQTALDILEGKTPDPAQEDGPFVWDSVVTGDVVGMFFAGYMVFQVLALSPSLHVFLHRCQEVAWPSCTVARR